MDWLAGQQDAIEAALARRNRVRGRDGPVRPVVVVGGGQPLRAGGGLALAGT
ncbi:MAG TPA: hypothetical protein VLW50_27290 [Streptosporangiaceae bacterium]|nr:hypothetical protein [Streptosporangiaceae bacterium]